MKKTVLNIAIIGLSLLSLYAFSQMHSSQLLKLDNNTAVTCDSSIEFAKLMLSDQEKSTKETVVTQQELVEKTIPRFHQQLNTFSPF